MSKAKDLWSQLSLLISVVIMLIASNHAYEISSKYGSDVSRRRVLQSVVDASASGLIVTDSKGIIVEWSARATEMLGWSRDEMIGVNITFVMPPDQREKHRMQYMFGEEIKKVLFLKCWVYNRRNELIEVSVSVRSSKLSSGDIYYAVIIDFANDIKELGVFPKPDDDLKEPRVRSSEPAPPEKETHK